MTTTSTQPLVTVKLDTAKAALARVGSTVSVDLPSGDTVDGKVTKVGKVATTPPASDNSGGDSTPTIKVSVRMAARTKTLDQAPVTVNFEQSRRRNVLAIPVTALLARPGGKFAVEVRDGGGKRLVAVEPGLYAGGFVEIGGRGLAPGMKVTDARI
jgi:multidrug efflux pump subunit AcrA (membrane-fusion protein)